MARYHHGAPRHFVRVAAAIPFVVFAGGCVAPMTQMGSVSQFDLQNEQLRQQALVITSQIKDQQRVDNIGYPLLHAALPICGPGMTNTRSGFRFATLATYKRDYQAAARAVGFTDTVTLIGVTLGSAAERAGLRVGDRIIAVNGQPTVTGGKGPTALITSLDRARNLEGPVSVVVHHAPFGFTSTGAYATAAAGPTITGPAVTATTTPMWSGDGPPVQVGSPAPGTPLPASAIVTPAGTPATPAVTEPVEATLAIASDTVCDYNLVSLKEDVLNAFADGKNVYVTTAMLRFAAADDELAIVLSHEISHNAMRHMDAKKKNAALGALFGAILDVAAASQGINTQGEFTNDMAAAAGQAFSQDFEREADYVGMYVLARSGRPFDAAADFWRRMAQESPGSIKFATSHPTTAERFIRLGQAATEIHAKEAAHEPLLPEMKRK